MERRSEAAAETGQPRPLTALERWLAGMVGGLSMGTGAAAVFVTENGAGSTALMLVGALFLIVALTDLVPQRFKLGDNEITLIRAAAELRSTGLSTESTPAEQLRELAVRYETIRNVLPSGARRTILLESVLLQARALAAISQGDTIAARVSSFPIDSEGKRAVTLALLEAQPIATSDVIALLAECIPRGRSNFEGYHALVAATELYPLLAKPFDRERLRRAAIELLRTPGVDAERDRAELALQLSSRS